MHEAILKLNGASRTIFAAALAMSLAACAGSQAQENDDTQSAAPAVTSTNQCSQDHVIHIFYDGDNCPIAVDQFVFDRQVNDNVRWMSAETQGTNVVCTDQPFKIYFSPFAGDEIGGQNGMSPNRVINAPYTNVLYKYTIVSMDPDNPQQPAPNCTPLDPFLRVY